MTDRGNRGEWGAMAFALAFPTVVTIVYFVLLANEPAAWQQIAVSYAAPAGVALDVNVYSSSTGPGACFYADDIAIVADRLTPALAVTPQSGLTPLTVTADASGSSDADSTPIAGYRFDFGDGSAALIQSSPTASHRYTVSEKPRDVCPGNNGNVRASATWHCA